MSKSCLKLEMDVGGAYGKSEPMVSVISGAPRPRVLAVEKLTVKDVIFRNSLQK